MQGVFGIMIFRGRVGFIKKKETSFPSPDQPYALKEEAPMRTLSFEADIRPLFRSYDIDSMKQYKGIDLSSLISLPIEMLKNALKQYTAGFLPKTCRAMGRGAMTLCKNSRIGWRAVWSLKVIKKFKKEN